MSVRTVTGAALVAIVLFASGCAGSFFQPFHCECVSYVKDPHIQHAPQVTPPNRSHQVNVVAKAFTNDVANPAGDPSLARVVELALRTSGVLLPAESKVDNQLFVSLNNQFDEAFAIEQGRIRAQSRGAEGLPVEDHYLITLRYVGDGGREFTKQYQATMVTACLVPGKSQLQGATPFQAFADVVDTAVFSFLADLQINRLAGP